MLAEAEEVSRWDFPQPGTGLTPAQDADLSRVAISVNLLRQCSIGDHTGCTDPTGEVCTCPCHRSRKALPMSLPEFTTDTPQGESVLDLATNATDPAQAVFVALGAASACWENLENAGVFQSTRARQIGDELMAYLYEHGLPRG